MIAFASHSIPWSSPCRMHELSVLSDFLDLFINFTFPPLLHHYPQVVPTGLSTSLRLSSKSPVHSRSRRWGDNFTLTGFEPKDYFLTETLRRVQSGARDRATISPSNGSPRTWITTDAAIGQMLFNAYRRQVDHSEREGLSSGLSSSSMSKRTDEDSFGPTKGANPR